LLLVGTFAGLLKALPKAGGWMLAVKRFMGILLIIVGIYFIIKSISLFVA
jgi:thiol:disulfide interchange protein DsbD